MKRGLSYKEIGRGIQAIYERYHLPEYTGLDPIVCVRRFSSALDIETAGLTASVLSYGRVERIIASVESLFSIMGESPYDFVMSTGIQDKRRRLSGFRHRFNKGDDLAVFLHSLKKILSNNSTLEDYFIRGSLQGGYKERAEAFVQGIRERGKRYRGGDSRSFEYLLPRPFSGSACKRLNMYFRWMIRPEDGIDFGLWKRCSAADLIYPLDVHIKRIASDLGATTRSTPDWKMAEQVTDFFKGFSPEDPVKYDFSLCRYGMLLVRKLHKG